MLDGETLCMDRCVVMLMYVVVLTWELCRSLPVVVGVFLINDGPAGVAFRAVSHQVSILGFGTGCSISVVIIRFPCVLCVKAVNGSC